LDSSCSANSRSKILWYSNIDASSSLIHFSTAGGKQAACGVYHAVFVHENEALLAEKHHIDESMMIGQSRVIAHEVTPHLCGVYNAGFVHEDGAVVVHGSHGGSAIMTHDATDSMPPSPACGAHNAAFVHEDGAMVGRHYADGGTLMVRCGGESPAVAHDGTYTSPGYAAFNEEVKVLPVPAGYAMSARRPPYRGVLVQELVPVAKSHNYKNKVMSKFLTTTTMS
jgi:hypothetical protein